MKTLVNPLTGEAITFNFFGAVKTLHQKINKPRGIAGAVGPKPMGIANPSSLKKVPGLLGVAARVIGRKKPPKVPAPPKI